MLPYYERLSFMAANPKGYIATSTTYLHLALSD